MRAPAKIVARTGVIACLGSFIIDIVFVRVHKNEKADATEFRDFGIQLRRLTR
jgi:hypothetical protein